MFLSEAGPFLLVHVQRTAGTSLKAALSAACPDAREILGTHDWAATARAHLGARYEALYRFAFVRNPWDRLVSCYELIREQGGGSGALERSAEDGGINRLWRYALARSGSFREFILRCDGVIDDVDGRKSFAFAQCDYVCDAEGRLIVDDVYRFEDLPAAADHLFETLQIRAALPRLNPSRHRPYREYYDAETRAVVARRFARDIARFGYEF
jgi:hypothetical protein